MTDERLTLEACICGEHRDCPDGWHEDLPCGCTPDCALKEEPPCPRAPKVRVSDLLIVAVVMIVVWVLPVVAVGAVILHLAGVW